LSPSRIGRFALRVGAAVGALGVLAVAAFLHADARSPFPLDALSPPAERVVRASDGTALALRVASDDQWCRPIPLAEMGDWLPRAAVAVEDVRFRRHAGVDPRAIGRAAAANARAMGVRQGGSTITMQLASMALGTERSLRGKAVEAFRALQLERLWSKDEILEAYLNRIPQGGNAVGVWAGARAWFGKEPADLALHEAALLAGLPQAPARLRPDRHPGAARDRRRRVLERMCAAGMIREDALERAASAPLPVRMRSALAGVDADLAPHAAERLLARRAGGGTSTIDPAVQELCLRVAARHARALPAGTDVAIAVVDVEAAALVAHVGSADHRDPVDGQVDGAFARRSPGSALKPFVYAAAFERGRLAPGGVVVDGPIELAGWRPGNFEDGFAGEVSVADALRRSLNTPAFRAASLAGIDAVLGAIEAAGIDLGAEARAEAGLAVVTGAAPVRLVDLATGYATLARGGLYVPTRTTSDAPIAPGERVLSKETCDALYRILSDDARAPRVRGGASHVGGVGFMWKTGTSSGHADAVAAGHGRGRAIAVWVGRFDGAGDPRFVGCEAAEPILAELFAAIGTR